MYCQPILIKVYSSSAHFVHTHTKNMQAGHLVLFGSMARSEMGKALAKNNSSMNWGALKPTAGFIAGIVGLVSVSETCPFLPTNDFIRPSISYWVTNPLNLLVESLESHIARFLSKKETPQRRS